MRNQTSDLWILGSDVLLLNHRDFMPNEVYYCRCEVWFLIGTLNFSLSHTSEKTKQIFFYFFTKLKTYHFSYSIYKHDAIDKADPSS